MSKTPKLPKKKRVVPPGSRKGIGGRPTKYTESLCDELVAWFRDREISYNDVGGKIVAVPPEFPTLVGFAKSKGHDYTSMLAWRDKYEEFSRAYKTATALQEDLLVRMGLAGHYSTAMAIFTLKNVAGWRDKSEMDLQASGDVTFVMRLDNGKA